jgi:hypothetical protein
VAVGSHAQIPHFLLSICRAAARGVPLAKASGPPRHGWPSKHRERVNSAMHSTCQTPRR